eukprot:m.565310 g.565310  ORF g.565310 m.565310 type:complete len:328 (-) comp57823_c0_seq5:54-1037(-)
MEDFDLEGYIASYSGNTRIARLLFIANAWAKQSPPATARALRLCGGILINSLRYTQFADVMRRLVEYSAEHGLPAPDMPSEQLLDLMRTKASTQRERLEMELKISRQHNVKETTRFLLISALLGHSCCPMHVLASRQDAIPRSRRFLLGDWRDGTRDEALLAHERVLHHACTHRPHVIEDCQDERRVRKLGKHLVVCHQGFDKPGCREGAHDAHSAAAVSRSGALVAERVCELCSNSPQRHFRGLRQMQRHHVAERHCQLRECVRAGHCWACNGKAQAPPESRIQAVSGAGARNARGLARLRCVQLQWLPPAIESIGGKSEPLPTSS